MGPQSPVLWPLSPAVDVDPTRLRADPLYAVNCLCMALCSPGEALQGCARFLQTSLGPQ